jgi:hypothetical protein
MAAEYNESRQGGSARPQAERQCESADSAIQMCVDDGVAGSRERHRARVLLIGQFRDDEDREDPAVEVATPQVRERARRHDAVQRARSADIPVELGIEPPEPRTDGEPGARIDSRPAPRRIVAREQCPHEHDPEAVEQSVFGIEVYEMCRQHSPPLAVRDGGTVETERVAQWIAAQFQQREPQADAQ